jgi:hypothetical protein
VLVDKIVMPDEIIATDGDESRSSATVMYHRRYARPAGEFSFSFSKTNLPA